MNKTTLVGQSFKLAPLVLALALSQSVLAAEPAKRDVKVIQAQMQELGKEMAKLAEELRAAGGTGPHARMEFKMLGDHHAARAPLSRGAALGVVLSESEAGVAIDAVTPGSGAEKAGLKAGDVLLSVRGKALAKGSDVAQVRAALGELKAGDSVPLQVNRAGKTLSLTATASEQPRILMIDADAPMARLGELRALEGLSEFGHWQEHGEGGERRIKIIRRGGGDDNDLDLTSMSPDLSSYFGTSTGVLTLKVKDYAPLLAGDVILRVNNVEVKSPSDVFERFRAVQGQNAEVAVIRQKAPRTLTVKIPQMPHAMFLPAPPAPPAPPTPPAPPGAAPPPPPPAPPPPTGVL